MESEGQTLKWITSFLSDRSQTVIIDGEQSNPAHVSSGVPQGSVLGPLLFLIFINDLPESINNSTVRLFADDAILYREIATRKDSEKLQEDLDKLEEWERKWMMSFNASKYNTMHISRSRSPRTAMYTLHGTNLEPVDHAKYRVPTGS